MKILPDEIRKIGFTFKKLHREECPVTGKAICIYEQWDGPSCIAFEVFVVKRREKEMSLPGGGTVPPAELYPSSEEFSIWAASIGGVLKDREKAEKRAFEKVEEYKAKLIVQHNKKGK